MSAPARTAFTFLLPRLGAFLIAAAIALTPSPASAGCSPSLVITGEPPLLTLTGSTSSTCSAHTGSLEFFMNGNSLMGGIGRDCPGGAVSCSISIDIGVSGLNSNTYHFSVSAGCGEADQNGCAVASGSANQDYPIDSSRTGSATFDGADETGHGTMSLTYDIKNAFPTEPGVSVYVVKASGGSERVIGHDSLTTFSGSFTDPFLITCKPTGTLQYYGGAYNLSGTYAEAPKAIQIKSKPTVKANVVPDASDPDGNTYIVKVHYKFPNTDAPGFRDLRAFWLPSKASRLPLPTSAVSAGRLRWKATRLLP